MSVIYITFLRHMIVVGSPVILEKIKRKNQSRYVVWCDGLESYETRCLSFYTFLTIEING